jgi:segregation and condensation protein B
MTDSSSNGHLDGVPGEGVGSTDVIRAAARRALEALVLVAEQPLTTHLLGQLLELSPIVVDTLCRELAAEYEEQGRGFQLVEVAGGWRYQSHPDQAPYVERLVLEGQTAKLSAAALETLAIVAYKQPLSRAQVAAIRGVSVDGVMRTLQQRGYIAEIGKDPGPGQAVLFGTTPTFLEKLGLNDLDELPPLGDFVPGADVVEQLERGLRPDREPWRPEDALPPAEGDADESDDFEGLDADMGADESDPFDAVDADMGADPDLGTEPDVDTGPAHDPAADPGGVAGLHLGAGHDLDARPARDPAADPDRVAGLDPDEG